MDLLKLKQRYQKQLVKVGVHPFKAEQAAKALSAEELLLISDIWPEWATVFSKTEQESDSQTHLFYNEVHFSVSSKIKRVIDLAGAVIGLLLTAIIFLPIALLIKVDSPGPIFYSQIRCGLQGKPFRIWKFRTMFAEAEQQKHLVENEADGYIFKNKNDPRITRVGKFLRCTSLDELPQFWNVLKGEMSLVGTRPPTPDEVKLYQSHHYKRFLVKPGITGEWQVNGRSIITSFDDIVSMDLDYQHKWSPLYDLDLILKTIRVVVLGKGAY
jgi:lipopolysaccharide/colanic/teichoic acid biosynthesis glycosyltransferase